MALCGGAKHRECNLYRVAEKILDRVIRRYFLERSKIFAELVRRRCGWRCFSNVIPFGWFDTEQIVHKKILQ